MKTTVSLLLLAATVMAGKPETGAPVSLKALKLVNKSKDARSFSAFLANVRVKEMSVSARDDLASELARSLTAFRKNTDVERDVIKTLGELRSRRSTAPLKKLAFRKKTKGNHNVSLQVAALRALGEWSEPKLVGNFEKVISNRNVEVAKAAYIALGNYGASKARLRKRVTEFLIKRLGLEYPAYSNSNGKWIGEERRARWRAVSRVITASLRSVSHESSISEPQVWQQWWKENKKKQWKDLPAS